jgi:hypothetical protein
MLIIDAQIHLWETDRPDRPWMKGLQRPPHRPNGFSAQEILAEMDEVGVNRAVIVPPPGSAITIKAYWRRPPSIQADLRSLAVSIPKHRMLASS